MGIHYYGTMKNVVFSNNHFLIYIYTADIYILPDNHLEDILFFFHVRAGEALLSVRHRIYFLLFIVMFH